MLSDYNFFNNKPIKKKMFLDIVLTQNNQKMTRFENLNKSRPMEGN